MVTGARSDTTLLVHLPADRESALVVSIPRDTIVDIPSCKTDTGMSSPYTDRFNSAFSIGGPGCTIKTVEQNTGVFIDHFVIVDFSGFNDIVDALGGVDVCLPYDVVEPKSGLNLRQGSAPSPATKHWRSYEYARSAPEATSTGSTDSRRSCRR